MGAHLPLVATTVGDGPPLILIHGDFNTGLAAWRRQIERPRGRRLIVPDRRGYGSSPPLLQPHTFAGEAHDILRLADAHGLAKFSLAGHSYGGLVAIATAVAAPGRVRSLVLVEPPFLALLPEDPDVVGLREGTAALWTAAPGLDDDEIAARFFENLASAADAARLRTSPGWPSLVRAARRAVRGQLPAEFPVAAIAQLDPALGIALLAGGRSHPGLRAISREISRILPRAALVVASTSGHAAQIDEAAFDAALVAADEAEDGQ